MGVSVKAISSETTIINEAVSPNGERKRPASPPMKHTGRKTASSESVVAAATGEISRVA